MQFPLTSEQRSIQRAVNEFTRGEYDNDQIFALLKEGRFPERIWKKACQLGFIGLLFPEECGGQECSLMEQILVTEAMCRKDSSVGIALTFADMGAEIICALGSALQKKRLFAITKGKHISAAIFFDLDKNSAASASGMMLTKDAGTYRLNGRSRHVFNADLADFYIVQCRFEGGQGFVLVEKGAIGVSVAAMGSKLGLGMLAWYEVAFDDVEVACEQLLLTDSADYLKSFPQHRLLRIAAIYVGVAQGAYDQAIAYSKQRVQFKRKLAEFQGIRHKLADMYRQLTASRSLLYHAGSLLSEATNLDIADLTMVKLQAEETCRYVCYEALQIFGGTGYMVEMPIEHFYRDAVMLQAMSGRSIFQKDRLAEHIIGRLAD